MNCFELKSVEGKCWYDGSPCDCEGCQGCLTYNAIRADLQVVNDEIYFKI